MCAPGLLCRLLFLLFLLLAAAPGAAPGTGAAPPGRPRARRGLTYPGTLWCGAGSNADAYEQLGKGGGAAATCPLSPSHPYPILIPILSLSHPIPCPVLLQPSPVLVPVPVLGQSPSILVPAHLCASPLQSPSLC